ncbi:MAG: hypothetical protein JNM45_06680 [Rhizobiales bacterium]|nr:hypothetical protein [Hyphomicrobiales bacterium]
MELADDDFLNLCACVGNIIVPFSLFEASMNMAIEAIYSSMGGNKLEKEIPRAFERRLTYLRKCAVRIPELSPVKDELLANLDEIEKRAELRNHVAHGFISHFDPKSLTVTFTLLEAYSDKQKHTEKIHPYTAKELLDGGYAILKASGSMNLIAKRICEIGMGKE